VTKKRIRFALAALAMLSVGVAAPAARTYASTPDNAPFHGVAWIVSARSLTLLGHSGLTESQLRQLFGNQDTFLTGGADGPAAVTGAVKTATFTSYAALSSALAAGHLPAGTRAILYDDEDWPLTPVREQQDPARYEQLAADLAHAHHLLFVSTPATDLTTVLAPHAQDHYAAYLRLHIAADAARYADVVDIQAQGSEADLATFVPFVKAAAAQARQANPRVIVLAGISTNPSGQAITGAQLVAAVLAVRPFVGGFWLNIPSAGAACPRCGVAQPQVAVPVLRLLLQPHRWAQY
jgi:hypothetical protein